MIQAKKSIKIFYLVDEKSLFQLKNSSKGNLAMISRSSLHMQVSSLLNEAASQRKNVALLHWRRKKTFKTYLF